MSWTAIIKNTAVEDDPVLTVIPYFGDDDREGVDLSLYQMDGTREEEHDAVRACPAPFYRAYAFYIAYAFCMTRQEHAPLHHRVLRTYPHVCSRMLTYGGACR